MDKATAMALRSIVRGLRRAAVIDDRAIMAIMDELQIAAGKHFKHVTTERECDALMDLANQIGIDARIGD